MKAITDSEILTSGGILNCINKRRKAENLPLIAEEEFKLSKQMSAWMEQYKVNYSTDKSVYSLQDICKTYHKSRLKRAGH